MVFNIDFVKVLVTVFLVKFSLSKNLEKSYDDIGVIRKPRGYGYGSHHYGTHEHYTPEHPVHPVMYPMNDYWHQHAQPNNWGYNAPFPVDRNTFQHPSRPQVPNLMNVYWHQHAQPNNWGYNAPFPPVPNLFYDLPYQTPDFDFPEQDSYSDSKEDEYYHDPTITTSPVNTIREDSEKTPQNIHTNVNVYRLNETNEKNKSSDRVANIDIESEGGQQQNMTTTTTTQIPSTEITTEEEVILSKSIPAESENSTGSFEVRLQDIFSNVELPPDPCTPYDPQTPDFSATGLKKNEIKCREFIWTIKKDIAKMKRLINCFTQKAEESRKQGVYYAIGGFDTAIGQFPHMGAIGWKAAAPTNVTWVFKCGSTLISHKFVLTAAHCTYIPVDSTIAESEPKIVRLGDKNIIRRFIDNDVNILRSIVHPLYDSPKKYYDIALMELVREVAFSNTVRPACLWNDFDTNSIQNSTVTGWGTVDKAKFRISPELQVVNIDVIDSGSCNGLLRRHFNRNFRGVQEHQVCGGVLAGGVDSCQGDSGGPFQVELGLPAGTSGHMYYVFGVTSFGIGCAEPNTPAVYTRVSEFVDWIEDIVW